MVLGVSEGFKKELQLIGVGYRASMSGADLTMNLGYSHPVVMQIPEGVNVEVSCWSVRRKLAAERKVNQPQLHAHAEPRQLLKDVACMRKFGPGGPRQWCCVSRHSTCSGRDRQGQQANVNGTLFASSSSLGRSASCAAVPLP